MDPIQVVALIAPLFRRQAGRYVCAAPATGASGERSAALPRRSKQIGECHVQEWLTKRRFAASGWLEVSPWWNCWS